MKVCIIGNNLTSLVLANILSKKKISTEIYSNESSKVKFKTRTLGISNSNLSYLEKYFKNIKKITKKITQIGVLVNNNDSNQEVIFNQKSTILFNMIRYDDLKNFLLKESKKEKNITFKKINRKKDFTSLTNNKKFNLIFNCEGKNSFTKKYLKKIVYKDYNNLAFTTIIKHKKIENHKAFQVFTQYGPIAFLPLTNDSTSVVFSFETKNKKISNKRIFEIIKRFNPIYKILSYEKIEFFKLKLQLSKKYFFKNILFFGDPVHSVHPLAGQGFNMTIRDIIKLDKIITKKIGLGLAIDKNLYKEFEDISKAYNTTFSFGIDLIYEFFRFNKNFIPGKISKKIFSFINKNDLIKNLGIKIANQGIL